MLFPSFIFLFFFLPLLLILYYTVCNKKIQLQNILLTVSGLLFYAWGEPVFVFAMLLCIFINWGFGYFFRYTDTGEHKITSAARFRKLAFVITLIADLSILAWFKYAGFAVENLNRLLPFDIPVPQVALPIGISFFTFQAISYTIDVYRGTVRAQKSFFNVALYISLFPQLIAGPIIRYSTIEHEINCRKFTRDDFSDGVTRFIIGLGKKTIIANVIALAADFAFEYNPAMLSVCTAWLGAAAYGLQIYFDFSGYSDMAIGLGRMFGFHFPENFNYPYISRSISDFWRRWHISLSSWFRDYVYIPLGGSRVNKKPRLIFNLFVVWALTGLWHGASWTFVCWGLLFFILISFEKTTGFGKYIEKIPLFGNIYMLIFVLIGWVLFRSPTGVHAFTYIISMFAGNDNAIVGKDTLWIVGEYSFTWSIGIIGCLPIISYIKKAGLSNRLGIILFKWVCLACVTLISLACITGSNYNPFIYFNF